jgi:CBS domain containing-hemolysin-like protein
MILLAAFLLSVLLCLVSFVQLLYLESLRLRTREYPSLQYFKETIQEALGYETERGALVFSLIKHTLLVLCGTAFTLAAAGLPLWLQFLEGFGLAWLVMLACGYFIPQILYRRSGALWLLPLLPFLRVLEILFRPLTALLSFLQSLFELSSPAGEEDSQATQQEEIDALISVGEEEGIIEEEDSRLIQSVVAFGDKRVREVMTPRPSVVAIDVSASLEELRRLVRNEQYSRIPVQDGTLDHIAGFVHVRDLYELEPADSAGKTLHDVLRPLPGVPESMPVSQLLKQMQSAGTHMVYVVNEYGNVAGIATMEDVVEEILGEIRDEHEPAHDVLREPGGAITVSGSFDVDHLAEHFGYHPHQNSEAVTVGGLVTEWLGSVPPSGYVAERDGLRIQVLSADGRRVERVRISALPEGQESEAEIK